MQRGIILQVASESRIYVRADVDEADIGPVRVGQEARFRVDAFSQRDFTARVSRIADSADRATKTYAVELRQLSYVTDLLSGITAYCTILAPVVDTPGVLSCIDPDKLKAITGSPGHQAGDEVRRHVARLLRGSVRAIDVAARVGGDEFAVILVHTSAHNGRQRIGSLDREVNQLIVAFDNAQIPVRASFGVVDFDLSDDIVSLIAQADSEMYSKKRAKPPVLRPWLHRMVYRFTGRPRRRLIRWQSLL